MNNPVPGEGPLPCDIVLIGEAPGFNESREGRPFVGKSGLELRTYATKAGIPIEYNIYLTNLCKQQPPYNASGKQLPPTREDIQRDEPGLIAELLCARPRWIGAIGRFAARQLTGRDLDMESAHGLAFPLGEKFKQKLLRAAEPPADERNSVLSSGRAPRPTQVSSCGSERDNREPRLHGEVRRGWDAVLPRDGQAGEWCDEGGETSDGVRPGSWIQHCLVVPLYHPAAGLHNANVQRFVYLDIRQFGAYVRGRLEPITPVNEYPHPDYDIFTDSLARYDGSWIGTDVRSLFTPRLRAVAIDTEGLPGNPWGLSISNRPGFARVILRREHSQLTLLDDLLRADPRLRIIFHNALHDVPILEELGIEIDWEQVEDTMLMAFCLGTIPLGLKPGGWRLSGVEMATYDETIAPAERRLSLDYVTRAITAKQCGMCGGTGKVPARGKKGQLLKRQDRCTACVDGGLWPAREGRMQFDWKTGRYKFVSGHEIQRYLRKLKTDIENGVFDGQDVDENDEGADDEDDKSIRGRWKSWGDDVRQPVVDLLGPMPEPTLDDIPFEDAKNYSAQDADVTLRNYPKIRAMLEEMELVDAYRLDLSVIPVAAEMQRNGMHANVAHFEALSRRLEVENDRILAELQHIAGRPINPASGDQVAAFLFGQQKLTYTDDDRRELQFSLELEPDKRTKGGKRESTDDKVIEGLKLKYAYRPDVVEPLTLITEYRIRHKIKTTYSDKIPRIVDTQSRAHTRIKPTTAATYRWASGDPINLQNIPIRAKGKSDLGIEVRRGFDAPDGMVLGSADFDQVELRDLAGITGDDELLRCFRTGLDPHILGASKTFRIAYDELKARIDAGDKRAKDMRASAKNINFGIVYGITARGLKAQMDLRGEKWTLDECQDLIDTYLYTLFPGIGSWMEETIQFARKHGYVRSIMGHIRHCPGVWSQIPSVRAEAERQACNFVIQCTAAEQLKAALRDLWRHGRRAMDAVGARLLMAVHDEVLTEQPDTNEAKGVVAAMVETYMRNPFPLPHHVEITASIKFASNWGDLKFAKDWEDELAA